MLEKSELDRPLKIRRITKPDGKVLYKFWRLEERGPENGRANPFILTQQLERVHVVEEPLREAPTI